MGRHGCFNHTLTVWFIASPLELQLGENINICYNCNKTCPNFQSNFIFHSHNFWHGLPVLHFETHSAGGKGQYGILFAHLPFVG